MLFFSNQPAHVKEETHPCTYMLNERPGQGAVRNCSRARHGRGRPHLLASHAPVGLENLTGHSDVGERAPRNHGETE